MDYQFDLDTASLANTPECRAWLETLAIQRCHQWREANMEETWSESPLFPGTNKLVLWKIAPYCCSAYCPRCIGLRALDGEPSLPPNAWFDDLGVNYVPPPPPPAVTPESLGWNEVPNDDHP